jgi:hypothetical protein
MSDPLPLVRHLGRLDDDALTSLLLARQLPPREIRDLFDLAEALLDPVSVRRALRTLPRRAIEQLAAGVVPEPSTSEPSAAGPDAALVFPDADGTPTVPAPVADTAREVLAEHPPAGPTAHTANRSPGAEAASETPDARAALARERAFTANSAVAELVQQLRLAPARVRARGGVSVAEEKRLGPLLSVPAETVGSFVDLATAAGLARVDGEELLSTASADGWNALAPGDRWLTLARAWLEGLDAPLPAHLRVARTTDASALEDAFPAADEQMHAALLDAAEQGELLGVWSSGSLSVFGEALFGEEPSAQVPNPGDDATPAGRALAAELPPEVDRVYLQHDLSIISPGPLPPAVDARLRLAADIENHGVASAYRVSQQSIDRALSSGETEASLREFLGGLSLTGIPQAVDYLLTEGSRRHGLVRVRTRSEDDRVPDDGSRTLISGDDPTVLSALAADQSLSALALRAAGAGRLSTRATASAAYWMLLDARYPVLAEDSAGTELVMRRARVLPAPVTRSGRPAAPPAVADLVLRLRETARQSASGARGDGRVAGHGSSAAPGADGAPAAAGASGSPVTDGDADARAWTARRLDRAVRARSRVAIDVRMPDGSTTRLDVVPLSLANGRLRVSDERAGVERTVPVANIVDLTAL